MAVPSLEHLALGEERSYSDAIHDLLLGAYENLNQKLDAAGRKVAPGETVEMEFDDTNSSFVLTVNTVPA